MSLQDDMANLLFAVIFLDHGSSVIGATRPSSVARPVAEPCPNEPVLAGEEGNHLV